MPQPEIQSDMKIQWKTMESGSRGRRQDGRGNAPAVKLVRLMQGSSQEILPAAPSEAAGRVERKK
jgi:hypothetical protein